MHDKNKRRYVPTDRVYGINVEDGKIYLVKDKKNGKFYKLPGGGVKPGETPAQALWRETKEEIGLLVEPEKEPFAVYEVLSLSVPIKLYFFVNQILGNHVNTDADTNKREKEIKEIVKASPEEIYEMTRNGEFEIHEDGGRFVYHTRALHKFIAERPELFYIS